MSVSRTQQLFDAASALSGDARERFLDEQCRGDAELRQRVQQLLQLDAESSFLAEDRLGRLRTELDGSDAPLPEWIGPFRVLARIGHGGMGIVYRAEQQEPRREIAVKVLAGSFATPSARARFAVEAEALGRLQHPGIAQIFAADVLQSPHGSQPYLAMELVRGEPLHRWAQRRRPALVDTLRLLLEIADAVHHAHQRSVIHRDLKPANVLVDEHGRAKVLDFGVARLLDGSPAAAQQTHAGQLLGTVAYMSPEQAAGERHAIDVRADVYSLGVIGYQLLAGVLPIDVTSDAITKGLQRIVADEPRPLGAVDRRLRGDLEIVFACALQKDPARRYASMAAFADDLRRYLAHEPIHARPATFAYVASRFLRRHALALTAVAAVFVGLVVALVVSVQATARVELARQSEAQARQRAEAKEAEARREERLKGDVLEVMSGVLASMHPNRTAGALQLPLRQRLQQALARLEGRFREAPDEERRVRFEISQILMSAGQYDEAAELLARVGELLPAQPSAEADRIRYSLAKTMLQRGDHEALLAQLDTLERSRVLTTPEFHVQLGLLRGQALHGLERPDDALAELRRALAASEAAPGLVPAADVATVHQAMAKIFFEQKDQAALAASVAAAADSLRGATGVAAEVGLQQLYAQAMLVYQRGDLPVAVDLFDQVASAWLRMHGPDHPVLAVLSTNRGAALQKLGRRDEAAAAYESAIALVERTKGRDAVELATPLANLAVLRREQQRGADAASLFARAIALHEASGRPPERACALWLRELAGLRLQLGDPAEHLALWQRSVRMFMAVDGEFHAKVLPRRGDLARLLADRGQRAAALAELQAIDDKLVEVLGASHQAAIDAAWLRAAVLLDEGRLDEVAGWIATFRSRSAGSPTAAKCAAEAQRLTTRLEAARR